MEGMNLRCREEMSVTHWENVLMKTKGNCKFDFSPMGTERRQCIMRHTSLPTFSQAL